MRTPTWLPGLLRFDAALNLAGAVVAAAAAGFLADALGLTARWPLYALAALFVVNGAMVWRAAKLLGRGGVRADAGAGAGAVR